MICSDHVRSMEFTDDLSSSQAYHSNSKNFSIIHRIVSLTVIFLSVQMLKLPCVSIP